MPFGPRVDGEGPLGDVFGFVDVASSQQELAGPDRGRHEPAAVVLAIEAEPTGVVQIGMEIAAVERDRSQSWSRATDGVPSASALAAAAWCWSDWSMSRVR